jgi:hypothetical protein
LEDHLTPGSNSANYTPVGPGFGNKFYLKRHADYVNTFTITGTTTINTVEITGVSETDIAKVKYGDVISGTGIPAGTITIAAVQPAKSQLRLSETGTATADGTVTLTIDSVPFGHAAHDIFCQVEVSAEGLVANTTWAPIGDGIGGGLTDQTADDLCVADTDDFIGLLNFFNPGQSNPDDLIKGASAAYTSDGKEYGGTSYPDIINSPFFPSNQGTSKAYVPGDVAAKGITGTQPDNLGDKDIWTGRFVRFDFERADNTGTAVGEYRYYIDNAEKFYYELPSNGVFSCGTSGPNQTTAQTVMPNFGEPVKTIPGKSFLKDAITRVLGTSVTITGGTTTLNTTVNIPRQGGDSDNKVPKDESITYQADESNLTSNPGTGGPTDIGSFYSLEANNTISEYNVMESFTSSGANSVYSKTYSYANKLIGAYDCVYNHVQKHLWENEGASTPSANSDVAAVESALDLLQASGVTSFRDPHIGATGIAVGSGQNDEDFQANCATHATTGPDGRLTVMKAMQGSFQYAFNNSNRVTHGTGALGLTVDETLAQGNDVDYFVFSHNSASVNALAQWESFSTAWTTLKNALTARIAEIDARIGVPGRSGTPVPSPGGLFPRVRVETIPSSPAEGQYAYDAGFTLVPYGRSIYNNVNHLLGQDVDLLGGIIKDIASLTDLIDLVKTTRNKYEIFSGRDKAY